MNPSAGVKYVSVWEDSGYGIAARRYMQGLIEMGVPLTWTPMIPGNGWKLGYQPFDGKTVGDPVFDQYCNAIISYDTVIIHTVPEYFPKWVVREAGKKLIGYTVWETDIIPHHWPALLNAVDQLMVPCHWNREVMKQCGVSSPISIIPHVVPEKREKIPEFAHPAVRADDFVFYSINTWTGRKAVWKTVEAYLETFTADDPVVLILKTSPEDFTHPWKLPFGMLLRRRHRSSKKSCKQIHCGYVNAARILVLDEPMSDLEIVSLHLRGDCYVSLCRSEGWGMGAFDASFYGNPVVMTRFGGQLDYLSDSTSYLVGYKPMPVEFHLECASYTTDQTWAEPDLQDASRKLRYVFENREEAKSRGRQSQKFVTDHFSMEKVCQKMYQCAVA